LDERRRLNRLNQSLECRFLWASQLHTARMTNLSYSGARVSEVTVRPSPGSLLDVVLIHEGVEISLKCRVVYARGVSLGLGFVEPKGAVMRKLSPLLRDRDEN
jgi:hypothetical protein